MFGCFMLCNITETNKTSPRWKSVIGEYPPSLASGTRGMFISLAFVEHSEIVVTCNVCNGTVLVSFVYKWTTFLYLPFILWGFKNHIDMCWKPKFEVKHGVDNKIGFVWLNCLLFHIHQFGRRSQVRFTSILIIVDRI